MNILRDRAVDIGDDNLHIVSPEEQSGCACRFPLQLCIYRKGNRIWAIRQLQASQLIGGQAHSFEVSFLQCVSHGWFYDFGGRRCGR
jgi:hypothetical protein